MTEVSQAAAHLRALLEPVAARPAMWLGRTNADTLSGFVTGCLLVHPGLNAALHQWSVAQLRGARDKYGWPGALQALAFERVAESTRSAGPSVEVEPFARAYLALVRDFLAELEDETGQARIEAAYHDARREYADAHEAHAHSGRYEVWDPGWHEECWEWQQSYAPALRHLPDDG